MLKNGTTTEWIAEAHRLGKEKGRYRTAMRILEWAAKQPDVTPTDRLEALHQGGVYAMNARQLNTAGNSFAGAYNFAEASLQKGNIQRDHARLYLLRGEPELAVNACRDAMAIHHDAGHRLEEAIDQGFLGRIYRSLKQPAAAYKNLAEADHYLGQQPGDDIRRLELYNKLHLASVLSRLHQETARPTAEASKELARQYGNPQHHRRAWILIHFGWRGDAIFRWLSATIRGPLNRLMIALTP